MPLVVIPRLGKSYYTDDEADWLAEQAGYGTFGGADWAEDNGYLHCVNCGGYMTEPCGYHKLYAGPLCTHCAAEQQPTKEIHP